MAESVSQEYAPTLLAVLEQPGEARVALIAPADGESRLVADIASKRDVHTDQAITIRGAVKTLQDTTGWKLLHEDGRLDRAVFGGVALSRMSHQRVTTLAISGSDSDIGTLRARLGEVEAVTVSLELSLQTKSSGASFGLQHAAEHLQGIKAQAIFVDVRSVGDASTLAALLKAADVTNSVGYVRVFYAGPSEIATSLQKALGEHFSVEHFSAAGWASKDFRTDDLKRAVGRLLEVHPEEVSGGITDLDGVPAVSEPAQASKTHAIRMLTIATRASTCMVDGTALDVDITVAQAVDADSALPPPVPSGRGAGSDVPALQELLSRPDLRAITQWLPFDIDEIKLRDYLGNRVLRPWHVPTDAKDLLVEGAVARACGRLMPQDDARYEFLVGSGRVALYPRVGQAVLTLLDIAQPTAPCRILLDRAAMLSRLGPLVRLNPEAGLSILRSDTLLNVGACLSLTGKAKQGESIGEISVHRISSSQEQPDSTEEVHEIRFGTITVIRLPAREQASLRVATGRRFSFGIDANANTWTTGSAETGLQTRDGIAGGAVGLIIDARGRPIELAQDQTRRQALMSDWLRSLDAYDAELFSVLD